MAIVFSIDKFMSECRTLANITATASRRSSFPGGKGELNRKKLNNAIGREIDPYDVEAAATTG